MFEKIGRAAEKVASGAGTSRRGFLGRCLRVAGGATLGAIPFLMPAPASGYTGGSNCDCKKGFPYGCKPGSGYEACVVGCYTKCNSR